MRKYLLIASTTLFLVPASAQQQAKGKAAAERLLTHQEIWFSPTFSGDWVSGLNSMKDGLHYSTLEEENGMQLINKYIYATGERVGTILSNASLVPADDTKPITISSYTFSDDETKILIATEEEPIYRHSTKAYYYVYDMKGKRFRPLSDKALGKQRLATFSPTGERAAFVRDNNIFTVDMGSMAETQITYDGAMNTVINGGTDWVYEEEFAIVQGYQWSPKGDRILYMRTDETRVKEFSMPIYGGELYPQEYRFKYPKAGEQNSIVELFLVDLMGIGVTQLPQGTGKGEVYIPRFGWTSDNETLWFMQMDRLQRDKAIYTVNVPKLRSVAAGLRPVEIFRERTDTYIEVTDDLHFLSDGSGFVLTSTSAGFNHIYQFDMTGKPKGQLTNGTWDVIEVIGVDEQRRRVIFASAEKSPTQQEIWSVGLNGKGKKRLSPEGGWSDADFSTNFNYFINFRSTANEPHTITLHDANGTSIKTLADNAELKQTLSEFPLQPKEFFDIDAGEGRRLNGWMIKPVGFQSRQKYPVLLTIYGGPGHNTVTDSWGGRTHLWHEMLAQEGFIVVSVDPRGTERRGSKFKQATYGQMGKLETEDMIATAKYLSGIPYVDGARIGVQGWSYGGYMSSLCLMKGGEHFKAAIAVAPVTNWRYYDTIYTERYMGLPQDNAAGYDDNSPINFVDGLNGPYMLVHGTADDNVHWQNSAEMINALVRANKQFDLMVYPDRNHGIYGGTTRWHLFQRMTDFLLENL